LSKIKIAGRERGRICISRGQEGNEEYASSTLLEKSGTGIVVVFLKIIDVT